MPTQLAHEQIASMRGKAKASLLLAIDDIRRRGCAAAGVRLAGEQLSAVCRLDLYGAWRLLTTFEAPDRCILLLVAEPHAQPTPTSCCTTRSASTSQRNRAPSRPAAIPKASHLSPQTSWSVSSTACETLPAGCLTQARPDADGHEHPRTRHLHSGE